MEMKQMERRLRLWRGVAGTLLGLGMLVVPLQYGLAQGSGPLADILARLTGVESRVATLEAENQAQQAAIELLWGEIDDLNLRVSYNTKP